jgi:DNA-binding NarL/FixJ family response regulator
LKGIKVDTSTLAQLLSPRELEHARLLALGLTDSAIARRMRCSCGFIRNRTSALYAKLGLSGDDFNPRVLLAVRYHGEGNE